ncbi:hypothetical protein NC651_006569 [Populus alba x Populus x berolinensis]|nr:hypothetical protein NC651_006569 [Populus alba x Populus x berolinensis]
MELCNISNPTRDGEEVQEARDRDRGSYDSFALITLNFNMRNIAFQSIKYNHREAIADGNSDQRHDIDCPYSTFVAEREWNCYGEGKRCGR